MSDLAVPTPFGETEPPLILLGVGASAGGLEAYQALLGALRETDNFALILVQHLDPEHESLMPELLSKRSPQPVVAITDGMTVEPGHIYLIPPAYALRIEGRTLRLDEFETPRGQRRPIDTFFESLAHEHGANAAAVILSGTGSDGAQGVRAIKQGGGLVFAQDPHDAKYDGMPRAAIATGAVDMVLPATEMVGILRDFHHHVTDITPVIESDAEFIEKVVRNVRYRTGHDFSGYKPGTLLRRITLRMTVLSLASPADYLRELVQNRSEADRLFRDLLINVTSFFRDESAFEALRDTIIPALLDSKTPDDELRIWVPGCSTGQEAYTVAMLVADEMSRMDARPRVSVFGTDIDEEALGVARRGQYPNSIVTEVPQSYLDRFFIPTRDGYEVRADLRDMVRFSAQSLIKDPPFSRIDLITCRNLLIYFDHALQDLALRVFHYALRPGGYLMLGPSEVVRTDIDMFQEEALEHRLWRRNAAPARPLDLPRASRNLQIDPTRPRALQDDSPVLGLPRSAARALIERHVPPFLLIGPNDEVTEVGPGADAYVRLPTGPVSLGLRALVVPALDSAVKRLLTSLGLSGGAYREIALNAPSPELPARLIIGAEALSDGTRIVTFRAPSAQGDDTPPAAAQIVIDDTYVSQLEDELEQARRAVRTTVEELETSNEELKSSNEEMMSMNEELQSANEELSSSNEELQTKVHELAEANADLANFMESTQIATVFLDERLHLRNFTPDAVAWFRFVEQDRGRALTDIGARLDVAAIAGACRRVIDTGQPEELRMASADGKAEVMIRFAPYRAETQGSGGVVFSVFDVTTVTEYARKAEDAGAEARTSAEEIEELYLGNPNAMGLVDESYHFLRANPRLAEITGIASAAHQGTTITEALPTLAPQLLPSVDAVFHTGKPVLAQVVRGRTAAAPDDDRVWEIDWYPVRRSDKVRAVGFNVTDVTHLLELQADFRRIMRELQHRVKNMLSNVIALVNRARRETGEPAMVLDNLAQRIRALANTHNLLTAENWASTSIRDILGLELINVYGDERVILRGPDIRLNARSTLAIGMAVHELATNAAKYGSFSIPEGRVAVNWHRIDEGEGERFVLRWEESHGPRVTEPERGGFGTQLIRSMIEGTLGGEITANWEPAGVQFVISLPWDAATEVDYDSDLDPLRHADPLP